MKILQINVAINTGSTGRITEQLGNAALQEGFESYIAFSRSGLKSSSQTIKIGHKFDFYKHVIYSRLFDRHGFASRTSTKNLIKEIEKIKPEIIHLHNIHGYYLHIEVLFTYLSNLKIPIVWTFHDCWPFTGHCAHFDDIGCKKWKSTCYSCPKVRSYPKSWFIDNSKSNFLRKKKSFLTLQNLTIIIPSEWLKNYVKQSFFNRERIEVINNGVDLSKFKPRPIKSIGLKINEDKKKIILGVASIWTKHRGLSDFIELGKILDVNYKIVLLGLSKGQIKNLPSNIIGIERTENIEALVDLYVTADVYMNPTYSDTFPTTNIEALACGTPVITYNTGGSPETIDKNTGLVIQKGDINGLKNGVEYILANKDRFNSNLCRIRAEELYDKEDRFRDYIKLYKELLIHNE